MAGTTNATGGSSSSSTVKKLDKKNALSYPAPSGTPASLKTISALAVPSSTSSSSSAPSSSRKSKSSSSRTDGSGSQTMASAGLLNNVIIPCLTKEQSRSEKSKEALSRLISDLTVLDSKAPGIVHSIFVQMIERLEKFVLFGNFFF
jgi:hypothetical protein